MFWGHYSAHRWQGWVGLHEYGQLHVVTLVCRFFSPAILFVFLFSIYKWCGYWLRGWCAWRSNLKSCYIFRPVQISLNERLNDIGRRSPAQHSSKSSGLRPSTNYTTELYCGREEGRTSLSFSRWNIRTGRNKQKLKRGTPVHPSLCQ